MPQISKPQVVSSSAFGTGQAFCKIQRPRPENSAVLVIHLSDYITAGIRWQGKKVNKWIPLSENERDPDSLRACLFQSHNNGQKKFRYGAEAEQEICNLVRTPGSVHDDFSFEYFENVCQISGKGRYMSEENQLMVKELLSHVVRKAHAALRDAQKRCGFRTIQIWVQPHIAFSFPFRKELEKELTISGEASEVVFYSDADIYAAVGKDLKKEATEVTSIVWETDALRVFNTNCKEGVRQMTEFPELGLRALVGYLWDYLRETNRALICRYEYDMRNVLSVSRAVLEHGGGELTLYAPESESQMQISVDRQKLLESLRGALSKSADFRKHCEELGISSAGAAPYSLKSMLSQLPKNVPVILTGSVLMIPEINKRVQEIVSEHQSYKAVSVKDMLNLAMQLRGSSLASHGDEQKIDGQKKTGKPETGGTPSGQKGESVTPETGDTSATESFYEIAMRLLDKQEDAWALGYLRIAAKQFNDPAAKEALGYILSDGKWEGREITVAVPEEALTYLKEFAESSPKAMNYMGMHYFEGSGVKKDDKIAFKWFLRSAEGGFGGGKHNVSISYELGEGVEVDEEKALSWLQDAAESGFRKSQARLAYFYETGGLGLTQDMGKALKWYMAAARQGNIRAQWKLAQIYEAGQGVPQSYAAALSWYNRLLHNKKATQKQKADALFYIGNLYDTMAGDDPLHRAEREKKAIDFLTRGAQLGSHFAAGRLGYCYCEGLMVQQDVHKGIELYQTAAAENNLMALNNLAICYEDGFKPGNIAQDIERAFEYYCKAVDEESEIAEGNLRRLQMKKYDASRAQLYRIASETEETVAQKNYAYACAGLYGAGAKQWLHADCLRFSARSGHIPSLLLLALCYKDGLGCAPDVKKAEASLEKAVLLHRDINPALLPYCYQHSPEEIFANGKCDWDEATRWYEEAFRRSTS